MPSFKKSLIVEQFQGNCLKKNYSISLNNFLKQGCNFNAFCRKQGQNRRVSAAQPEPSLISFLIDNDNSAKQRQRNVQKSTNARLRFF